MNRQFAKLLAIRLCSQTGDGLFQMGLASLFFFHPTHLASVRDVAFAFTVLLLPFTILIPFVGPFLDRHSRRQILLGGNLFRAALAFALAGIVFTSPRSVFVCILALICLGINRFLLAALSAALPHTLPGRLLVCGNSFVPSLGAFATALGAGIGYLLNRFTSPGGVHDALALVFSAVMFCAAGLSALFFSPDALGPRSDGAAGRDSAAHIFRVAAGFSLPESVKNTVKELTSGVKYLRKHRLSSYCLCMMAAHRFLYALNLISFVLISRNPAVSGKSADMGLGLFVSVFAVCVAGGAAALVLTPPGVRAVGLTRWVCACVMCSALSSALLTAGCTPCLLYSGAFLLGLGVQGAKIATDVLVQREIGDVFRGRAFAVYDMLYNFSFVCAACAAVCVLPETGRSVYLYGGMFCLQIAAVAVFASKTDCGMKFRTNRQIN